MLHSSWSTTIFVQQFLANRDLTVLEHSLYSPDVSIPKKILRKDIFNSCQKFRCLISNAFRRLNDTFGECGRPKVGWQIDPFGHSREMASIFAQLGFDGILLGRIDYQDKEERFRSKTPEFMWQSSDNLGKSFLGYNKFLFSFHNCNSGEKSKILTGVMYNTYSPPPGFCFDILCRDEPIIDNPYSDEYNVDKKVIQTFIIALVGSN